MIQSMTGFGKATLTVCDKKITAEIKSLNSKQLDLLARVPMPYREIELDLRNLVAQSLLRGKVELIVTREDLADNTTASINIDALRAYKEQIQLVSKELGIPEPSDWYSSLLRMPDALKNDQSSNDISQEEIDGVKEVVSNTVDALISFRKQEGLRLEVFFKEKIQAINQLLDEVPKYEKPRIDKIKQRILDALAKLENIEHDKNRFEQELIFYIEKLDITEEKIRLENHLKYFLETLDNEHGQGKKLGFISQEMGREINTLGSKANQAELQNLVVKMKDQLEQIKEQVLNVL
ncbi:MAG: YicC family protein [Muribaculaceae bacterium]|nr:YicC family protein [Muribaculaceae bacterium]